MTVTLDEKTELKVPGTDETLACRGWGGFRCDNEPRWLGRRPCCTATSMFCGSCKLAMQMMARRVNLDEHSCSFCGEAPIRPTVFVPA